MSTSNALARQDDAHSPTGLAQSAGVALARGETSAASVAARAKAEVEARALIAIGRPRDVALFRIKLLEACKRSRFAESARYSKPVGKQKVEGFSIRFAEECARSYGNLDIAAVIVYEDDYRRVFDVVATDVEANNTYRFPVTIEKSVERSSTKDGDEVLGKRTNSQGRPTYIIRATEDALLNKQAAAISKARRQLILQHIPSDITEEALEQIAATLAAEERSDPAAKRKRLVDAFYALGVMPDQIAEFLGLAKIDAMNAAQIRFMGTIYTGLRDGETTWAEIMASTKSDDGKTTTVATDTRSATARLDAAIAKPAPAAAPVVVSDPPPMEAPRPLVEEAPVRDGAAESVAAPEPKAMDDVEIRMRENARAKISEYYEHKASGGRLNADEVKMYNKLRRAYPDIFAEITGATDTDDEGGQS
jgi:hypothetical protein